MRSGKDIRSVMAAAAACVAQTFSFAEQSPFRGGSSTHALTEPSKVVPICVSSRKTDQDAQSRNYMGRSG